jgi:hypothetical protein
MTLRYYLISSARFVLTLSCSVRNDSVQRPDCWVRTRTVRAWESSIIIIIIIIIYFTLCFCLIMICLCLCVCMYVCTPVCLTHTHTAITLYDNHWVSLSSYSVFALTQSIQLTAQTHGGDGTGSHK